MSEGSGSAGRSPRSAPDVTSVLADLARLLRGRRFYPDDDPRLRELFQRAYRALRADLERAGPLALEVRSGGFRCGPTAIGDGLLDELARECEARGVRRLALDPELDAEALAAFVQVMACDAEDLAEGGGFEVALARLCCGGIRVNPPPDETSPPPGPEVATTETAPEETGDWSFQEDEPEPEPKAEAPPVAAGFAEPPTSPFTALLQEFDECDEVAAYARLADRILESALDLADLGQLEEAYGAIVTLYAHAGDERKHNAHQREVAQLVLGRALKGRLLAEVLRRACELEPDTSVQATQVLLQAGERVVPEILRAIHVEAEPERLDRLTSILLALAEKVIDALFDAMEDPDPKVARTAVRLAGETQNPQVVDRLQGLLERPELRHEATKALARLDTPAALQVLVRAVEGPDTTLAREAAFALASTGQTRVVPALARALRRAVDSDDTVLARELCRALGRLGRAEAAPELAGLLRRRSLLQRSKLREIKVAAATALARIPGDVAYGALAQAASARDARLRKVAQDALDRRAERR